MPTDGLGIGAGLVLLDGDLVIPGRTRVLLLHAPDALEHRLVALDGARLGQSVGELLQFGLEALREALGDAAFLLLALGGVAVEFDLAGVVVDHALRADGQRSVLFDQAGVVGIELPVAPTAHDHVAVALFVEPGDALLGGDAGVEHDRGRRLALLGGQRLHHLGQRLRLYGIAGEDSAALREAAGIEHQRQGHQRAVGTLLLGLAEGGIGVCMGRALEVGIGQVVERDHLVEIE